NDSRAMELFSECLKIDPRNDASLYEISQLYANNKKYSEAINFALRASEINPNNEWYKLLLGELYQRTGRYDDAASIYEKLTAQYPNRIDYQYQWAEVLIYANKLNDAIKVYDKIETVIGLDKEMTVRKEQIYLKQNKVDKAAHELENYLAKNPYSMDIYSMLYDVYL